jgi:hypoxanthine phosphoribosyltransferase
MSCAMREIKEVLAKSTLLYTVEQVENALDIMAVDIESELADSNLLCLTVMVGGLIPTGALLKRLHFPLEIDYLHATRYHSSTRGQSLVWKAKPSRSLTDRTVLIIDDILDGGVTLAGIVDFVKAQRPKAVYTAVLIDKQRVREPSALQKADFCALTVEDRYIYGYGMDYKEYLRNAPGIYAVALEHQ